jgi:L-alanine-DL-glutamate epimerase-like enolase superfamily enzyme
MAKIEKIELRMVDLVPKVKRTDAIQSFVSQETPIVTITDPDGATGTGYSYTIGTGGSSVMRLLADHLCPRIIGRDADMIEAIWHELEFMTHATTIGAITAIALAAIDTALWDLRAKKQKLPLWKLAGGAKESVRSIRPKAVGCISRRKRWWTMHCKPRRRASPARRSRLAARMFRKTSRALPRCARRSAMVTRS